MMKQVLKTLNALLIIFLVFACDTPKKVASSTLGSDGKISCIIYQLNDTYEIAGLERGTVGGMARVATYRKQLLKENPNTLFVHAGDFLNPSLIGTMKYEGKKIKGRQMIELMNETGVDLITFGNHEFDLDEEDLQQRLNESKFEWLGTNVRHVTAKGNVPFHRMVDGVKKDCPDTYSWTIRDADGTSITIGFFGATIDSNPKDYVKYNDYTALAFEAIKKLRKKTDFVLGLTHLEIDQDTVLARAIQSKANELGDVQLLMGGHDHDNMIYQIGKTSVTKADANARSAYVHRLSYDLNTQKLEIKSTLIELNNWIQEDPKNRRNG